MRKGCVVLSLLFLFFQVFSEEHPPEMTPEVVSDLEIMFENSSFQSYQTGMQFKFPHPVGFTCPPNVRDVDTDLDGVNEQYNLYSLTDCNGTNHVSTVKLQIGGNCTRWSTDAALETSLSIMLDANRPPSSNRTDWTPVHLSNSWTVVMTEQSANPGFIKNMSDNGTVPAYYFPFHTMPGTSIIGTDWEPHWNRIVGYPYHASSCNYPTAGIDYETNVKTCLKDEAILQESTFIFPDDADVMNVTFNGCVDLSADKSPVACPAVYGGIFDAIQPDYYNMEQKVKDAVFHGKAVLLRARTSNREPDDNVNSNNPLGLYDYVRYYPGWDLGDYFRIGVPDPPEVLRPDDEGAPGEYFNFNITHAITIVGYLENRCWDSNSNNLCDLPDEDISGDGRCTPRDCGTVNFTYLCGDTNHNGVCDGTEVCDPALSCATDTDGMLHGKVFEMQTQFDYFVIKDSLDQWWLNPGIPIFKIVAVPSSYDSVQDPGSTQRMIHGRTTAWTTGNYFSDAVAITYLFDGIEFGKMTGLDAVGNPIFDRNDQYRFSDNDGDGVIDLMDNCPEHDNPDQLDSDGDLIGDVCDNCLNSSNSSQLDSDGDLIGDACDNCPKLYNKNQFDGDLDTVGDVCDACPHLDNSSNLNIAKYRPEININGKLIDFWGVDSDLDGVPDVCDNCPSTPNPRLGANPFQERFLAPCDLGTNCEGGAYAMNSTMGGGKIHTMHSEILVPKIDWVSGGYTYQYKDLTSMFYAWQWDNDLDGIGDVCDYSGGNGIDNSIMKGTSTSRIFNVVPVDTDISEGDELPRFRENSLYKLTLFAAKWSDANSGVVDSLENTVHFCGMSEEEYKHPVTGDIFWGQTGYCTSSKTTVQGDFSFYKFQENNDPILFQGTTVEVPFGYSHGTDPAIGDDSIQNLFPWTHIARSKFASVAENISTQVEGYRNPIVFSPKNEKGAKCIQTSEDSGTACLIDTYWNWRMDALNYLDCENNNYAICEQLTEDNVVIPNETENFHFTLSAGAKGAEDNYLDEDAGGQSINPEYFHNTRKYARSARKTFGDMKAGILITGFVIKPIDWTPVYIGSSQPILGIRKINHWQVNGSNFRLVNKTLPEQSLAVTTGAFNTLYSVVRVNNSKVLRVNYEGNPNDWHDVTVIPDWPAELDVSSLDIIGSSIYVTGRDEELSGSPFRIYRFDMNPAQMTFNVVNELGTPLTDPRIINVGGNLIMAGNNPDSGKLEFHEFSDGNITKTGELPVRYGSTILAEGGSIYVSGGIDQNQDIVNDILVSEDLGGSFSTFADLNGQDIDLTTNFVHFSGGWMYIVNPKENTDSGYKKVAEIDLSDGSFDISLRPIEGISIEQPQEENYCLNETETLIKGGLEEFGVCIPFTHQWYNSFSAGATVYSVAGKGDRLYVGTDGLITVYDISDPAAMTYVTEYSVSGERVYDLEVANSEIYAATSEGLYRFDISDSDAITLTSSHYTGYNYQYRIQLYNDLLYVGDDYGINIRDKETFALISYVDDGAMLDFTVSEGKIALYSSAFLSSNIQVRDADSLNLLAWEYADCYTGELTSDHGEFYLTCDGYDYRFEIGSGSYLDFYNLEADMLELQENHVNKGWVYIPDGSNIKLSTNNDVPSLCGNGIIESGEVCDGDSIACTDLDAAYYGGTAYCNSLCSGYNEDSCETDDGW